MQAAFCPTAGAIARIFPRFIDLLVQLPSARWSDYVRLPDIGPVFPFNYPMFQPRSAVSVLARGLHCLMAIASPSGFAEKFSCFLI
jgi:hypothetical protein